MSKAQLNQIIKILRSFLLYTKLYHVTLSILLLMINIYCVVEGVVLHNHAVYCNTFQLCKIYFLLSTILIFAPRLMLFFHRMGKRCFILQLFVQFLSTYTISVTAEMIGLFSTGNIKSCPAVVLSNFLWVGTPTPPKKKKNSILFH